MTEIVFMKNDYVELRARSAFSFLAGASLPEDLIARAGELGYPALALGDRDGLYGAPRFHQAAQRAGLRAIVGCEITFGNRRQHSGPLPDPRHPAPDTQGLYLLVSNRTGYRNLCRLITAGALGKAKLSLIHI